MGHIQIGRPPTKTHYALRGQRAPFFYSHIVASLFTLLIFSPRQSILHTHVIIFTMHDTQNHSEELERLGKEIIELEHKMESTHEESGSNNPDDNSQEDTADYISRAQILRQIEEKRRRMVEIEELASKE